MLKRALVLLCTGAALTAQIPEREFAARRDSLAKRIDSGVVIAFGGRNPITDFGPFRQLPAFHYLTNFDEADAAFVMVVRKGVGASTLFITPADPRRAFYYGWRPDSAAVRRIHNLDARSFAALATVLLFKQNLGSVRIIKRLLDGSPPALPRLGFAVVDVRDLAVLHVRAMTAPEAGGQRFLATGEFLWVEDIARALRSHLGTRAARVPTRRLPDFVFRIAARFTPDLRQLLPLLGRVTSASTEKARRRLGFAPRPAVTTIVETAESLSVVNA